MSGAVFIFRSCLACSSRAVLGTLKEKTVLSRKLASCSLAALAGAAMLTFSMGPASAFTLPSPSLEQPYASAQIQKAWWHHYHRHCWRGRWGHLHCD
jgi:hypothetical protein